MICSVSETLYFCRHYLVGLNQKISSAKRLLFQYRIITYQKQLLLYDAFESILNNYDRDSTDIVTALMFS